MNGLDAYTELHSRLLEWGINEFKDDRSKDFTLLRSVRNMGVGRMMGYLNSLSLEEQDTLIRARVKLFSPASHAILTDDENIANRAFLDSHLNSKDVYENYIVTDQSTLNNDKQFLKKLANKSISNILNTRSKDGYHSVKNGDWIYHIGLDFGMKHSPGLSCMQYLVRSDADEFLENNDPIFFRWIRVGVVERMGIGLTDWSYRYYNDFGQIIDALITNVDRMASAISALTDSLNI